MRTKTKALVVILAILFIATSCKSLEIPQHQSVIETIPLHLQDMIEVMIAENGVFIFNPDTFGTNPDTYILISHNNKENVMVVINSLEYNDDKELVVDFVETPAQTTRDFSVVKLVDYTDEIVIADEDTWYKLDYSDLYFSSIGRIHDITNESMTVGIDTLQLLLNLSEDAKYLVDEELIETNDNALITYAISGSGLVIYDAKKIISSNTMEGQYTGHIDSHTIEIHSGGDHHSFQLSSKVQTQFITKRVVQNKLINFDYVELEYGQKLITHLYDD
jgi:hypothetical protein